MRAVLALVFWLASAACVLAQGVSSVGPVVPAANEQRVLCSIRAANFNSTADQSCVLQGMVVAWMPSGILVTNCSTSMTLAAGGFYPAASKGGTPLVAAAQVYAAATTSTVVVNTSLAANIATTRFTITTVFFSLTTAQGSAATCDIYLTGVDLT